MICGCSPVVYGIVDSPQDSLLDLCKTRLQKHFLFCQTLNEKGGKIYLRITSLQTADVYLC